MRKFKKFRTRALPFRLFLVVVGALLLMVAFAPSAKADLIAYFNFEGLPTPPYPVNLISQVPPGAVLTTITTNYTVGDMQTTAGIPLNVAVGDPDPNLTAMGLRRSLNNSPANFDIPLFSPLGLFQDMSISFAVNGNGNGFTGVTLFYSTNGGINFTAGPSVVLTQTLQLVPLAVPVAGNNAPLLVLRLQFTGGQSSGTNLQTWIDNIQINGTIIPEPATIAGGLLGVLGLGWQQRRRLIRFVRLRRA